MELSKLIEFNRLAREDGKKYTKKRFLFSRLTEDRGRHFLGIAGPRGAGKTVLLKQLALAVQESFYISLDTAEGDLFEIVRELHQNLKVSTFLLDEVHFNLHYEESLKKIYDFLDVKVFFTSSVSLALFSSEYDLSRRISIKKLYPFSFREYLYFRHDAEISPITIETILDKTWPGEVFSFADRFDSYIKGGNLPFSLEEPSPILLLKNIVNTVIRKDIAVIGRITMAEIDVIARLLAFIGKSQIDGINYSSLSRNLNITKYKAEQYVSLLEKAFILLRVMPEGTNVLKEPKILMALPYRLIYKDFEDARGALREDFFVETMLSLGKEIYYLKTTRGAKTPDYLIPAYNGRIVVEIGGKGKGRQQFKGITEKKKMILTHSLETTGIKRPLFLAGLI
ncbi:MAG: AAA family ATPase [Elusimicrobiota bacterium]